MSGTGIDPEYAAPSDFAREYRALGLQVVPARDPDPGNQWKRPLLASWTELQNNLIPDATFARWYAPGGEHARRFQMGFVTGRASGNRFVIDLDIQKHQEARLWWAGLLTLHNFGSEPETWEQRTGGGGRQLIFAARPDWRAPTNRTPLGVDIRGQGGFAMLPPSMHESGKRYEWAPGRAPWETEVAAAPEWLLNAVTELVERYGGDQGGNSAGPTVRRTTEAGEDLNAFGARVDGREDYMHRLIWGVVVDMRRGSSERPSATEAEAKCRAAYDIYVRNVRTRLPGENADGLEREGRGLTAFRRKFTRDLNLWDGKVASAAQDPRPGAEWREEPALAARASTSPLALVSAFPIIADKIPPRDWAVPGLLLRAHLSVLVAPPGSGKSLFTLQMAIMIAAALEWGGWKPRKADKVFVINAEDDVDEMRRRLYVAAQEMQVAQPDLVDRVLLAERPESIIIATVDQRTKSIIRSPLVDELVDTIVSGGIGVLVVDPFAETWEGDENDNSQVKWAGVLWREVARRSGCAVLLVHHTRKYAGGMAGDADASRGGGSLIGVARIISTLFAMTEEEASTMDVKPEDRGRFVRFDDAKANYTLINKAARWFEKRSCTLPNGTGFIPGDEVGVLVPWKPPGLLEEVSVQTINLVLETIGRGILDDDGRATGALFTAHRSGPSGARWAGNIIAQMLGCEDSKAAKILGEWVKSGVLVETEFRDETQRKDRKGLRYNASKRPGMVEE